MSTTPEPQEKYWQQLEELEHSCGGVFACISPERHKKRWEQKVAKLEQLLVTAETAEEQERLQQQLTQLNHAEQKKAERIAIVYSQVAQSCTKQMTRPSADERNYCSHPCLLAIRG